MTVVEQLAFRRISRGKVPAYFTDVPDGVMGKLFRLLMKAADGQCKASLVLLRKLFMRYTVTEIVGLLGVPGADFMFQMEDKKGHTIIFCIDYVTRVTRTAGILYFLFPKSRVDYELERWYKDGNRVVVPGYTMLAAEGYVARYALMDTSHSPLSFANDLDYKDVAEFADYLGKMKSILSEEYENKENL